MTPAPTDAEALEPIVEAVARSLCEDAHGSGSADGEIDLLDGETPGEPPVLVARWTLYEAEARRLVWVAAPAFEARAAAAAAAERERGAIRLREALRLLEWARRVANAAGLAETAAQAAELIAAARRAGPVKRPQPKRGARKPRRPRAEASADA